MFYGSKAAKEEGLVSSSEGQHSKLVGRGKYVHEKVTHAVIPSKRDEYLAVAEKYYTTLASRGGQLGGVKLTGSWETVIGSVGEFTHILEYEGYKGFDETCRALRNDKVSVFPTRNTSLMADEVFSPSLCALGSPRSVHQRAIQRHAPLPSLEGTPDRIRVLILAIVSSKRFRIPRWRYL